MLKVQEIREIIRLIDESSIDEFTYESNGTKVKMKKSSANPAPKTLSSPGIEAVETVAQEVELTPSETKQELHTEEKVKEEKEAPKNYDYEIVSPMVGTFYKAPSPESDPYVTLNSDVDESTVVCIVEAMKLFNEIEAEVSGSIVEILVEDGELVEYGQPLFRVKKK